MMRTAGALLLLLLCAVPGHARPFQPICFPVTAISKQELSNELHTCGPSPTARCWNITYTCGNGEAHQDTIYNDDPDISWIRVPPRPAVQQTTYPRIVGCTQPQDPWKHQLSPAERNQTAACLSFAECWRVEISCGTSIRYNAYVDFDIDTSKWVATLSAQGREDVRLSAIHQAEQRQQTSKDLKTAWDMFLIILILGGAIVGGFFLLKVIRSNEIARQLTDPEGMTITIEHHKTFSLLLRPQITVVTTVRISNELRAIIRHYDLTQTVVVKNKGYFGFPDDAPSAFILKDFMEPHTATFSNPARAKNWEDEVQEGLTSVKNYLDQSRYVGDTREVKLR